MGAWMMADNEPFGPLKIKALQSGPFGLPSWPILMVLCLVGLHSFRITLLLMVAICPVRLIEYQSAEMLRPGIKVGVITMPPDMVRATSGTRLGLPCTMPDSTTVRPVLGS